jgi:hypothetical protein
VFHTHVSDHGLHEVAAIMIAASIIVLLFTLADHSLRKRVGAQEPTNRPPPTHSDGEKAMQHIGPSGRTREAEAPGLGRRRA